MKNTKGTPSTLRQAVANGLDEAMDTYDHDRFILLDTVQEHVLDFIRNKLCVLTVSDDASEVRAAEKILEMMERQPA